MHWMYQNDGWHSNEFLGLGMFPFLGLVPLLLWSLAWKGWALWLAARRGDTVWFIVLLVVNTLGLLEIFYIFVIAKQQDSKSNEPIADNKEELDSATTSTKDESK